MAILGRRLDPADRPTPRSTEQRRAAAAHVPAPRRDGEGRMMAANIPTGRTGRAYATGGEASRTAKLTEADVAAIRAADYAEVSRPELAARYGVSPSRITRIRQGKAWTGS